MAAYDAICFDLDATLCESTQDPDSLLETAFERAGCELFCSPADLREAVPDLPPAQTDREFHELLFGEVATRADADPTRAPDLAAAYLEAFDPAAVRLRPGAASALDRARAVGPVGLITNGGRPTQTRKLEALDLADAFDAAVFTDPDAGVDPKPSTVPFERALAALEADADGAIHVGDSLHADVAGANRVGMDSAWLAGDGTPNGHEPTYELGSLEEFGSIV